MDEMLVHFVSTIHAAGRKAVAERVISAIRHLFPEKAKHLPSMYRYLQQLRRGSRGSSKPPMIWEVVLLVAERLIKQGLSTSALALLLQFDTFLRSAELCGIKAGHVAFAGGEMLGFSTVKNLILLPSTKTGPLQSVDIQRPILIPPLRQLCNKCRQDEFLFPSYTILAARLRGALCALKLDYIGYTLHSIRHGAATMELINRGYEALMPIMYRGRWESSAGKRYLQQGAAALIYAKIPRPLLQKGWEIGKQLPRLLSYRLFTPRH